MKLEKCLIIAGASLALLAATGVVVAQAQAQSPAATKPVNTEAATETKQETREEQAKRQAKKLEDIRKANEKRRKQGGEAEEG